ncbi:metalloprotease [Streptomyces sp. NA04227]|nr:metalloprotease [Streptomyces sp. NA04227]
MKFRSSSTDLWRVINPKSRAQYTFDTRHTARADSTVALGTVRVPADRASAWKIVDSLNELYWKASEANTSGSACWTRRQKNGHCDELTVTWGPKATDGGYFDQGGTNHIVLTAEDADSRHTVLHEAGHWLQWQLYGRSLPDSPHCEEHTFELASSPGCAWTEAFADAAAAYALGDRRYVYGNGESVELRADSATDWDQGDDVQGRVGGALLDLWAADGPDGGDWNRTIDLMSREVSEDFYDYFTEDRPRAGLDTTGPALDIVHDHTIDY